MAIARTARLVASETLGGSSRSLSFEIEPGDPLGFVGGQYVIVDSGVVLPDGKRVKRAYSIVSSDAEQIRFDLAVRRQPSGPGSGYLHDLPVGGSIQFSGPWGKFVPPGDGREGATLVIATDTGVTAALGLLRSSAFRARLADTTFVWFRESSDYFLSDRYIADRVPSGCGVFRVEPIGTVGHPERALWAGWCVDRLDVPELAYLAGDGVVVRALRDALVTRCLGDDCIALESFFHHLKKSS